MSLVWGKLVHPLTGYSIPSPGGALLIISPMQSGIFFAHPLPYLSLDCSCHLKKIHYPEAHPIVFSTQTRKKCLNVRKRFTAVSSPTDGVDNSDLLDLSTGQLTAVGEVFVSEYANLHHCDIKSVSPADNETWTSMETETKTGNGTSSPKLEPTQTPEPIGAPLSSSTTANDDHYTTWNAPEVSVGEPSNGKGEGAN